MIIKNGEVFQEDGSFRLQDLYVENHRIVASEDEVTDKTIVDAAGLRVLPGWWIFTVTVHLDMIFPMLIRKDLRLF